jgi:hypothetical protein
MVNPPTLFEVKNPSIRKATAPTANTLPASSARFKCSERGTGFLELC